MKALSPNNSKTNFHTHPPPTELQQPPTLTRLDLCFEAKITIQGAFQQTPNLVPSPCLPCETRLPQFPTTVPRFRRLDTDLQMKIVCLIPTRSRGLFRHRIMKGWVLSHLCYTNRCAHFIMYCTKTNTELAN